MPLIAIEKSCSIYYINTSDYIMYVSFKISPLFADNIHLTLDENMDYECPCDNYTELCHCIKSL